jgi:hypothetical protein
MIGNLTFVQDVHVPQFPTTSVMNVIKKYVSKEVKNIMDFKKLGPKKEPTVTIPVIKTVTAVLAIYVGIATVIGTYAMTQWVRTHEFRVEARVISPIALGAEEDFSTKK